jgi:hypothetical protein
LSIKYRSNFMLLVHPWRPDTPVIVCAIAPIHPIRQGRKDSCLDFDAMRVADKTTEGNPCHSMCFRYGFRVLPCHQQGPGSGHGGGVTGGELTIVRRPCSGEHRNAAGRRPDIGSMWRTRDDS